METFESISCTSLVSLVVAQEQDPAIDVKGLGLYGIVHDANGGVRIVGGGGAVRYNLCIASDRELAVAHAAGVVEKLAENEAYVFDDPLALFSADVTFDGDRENIVTNMRSLGIAENSPRFAIALAQAMKAAAAIIAPLLPRLREQVLRIERIVVERRLAKAEIMWSGAHASLLTGKPAHDYEIDYSFEAAASDDASLLYRNIESPHV